MLYKLFEFAHDIEIHFWELPTLIVGIVMVIAGLVHSRNQKRREKDFEEKLKKKYSAHDTQQEG